MCLVAALYNMKLLAPISLCLGVLPKTPNTYYKSLANSSPFPPPCGESQHTINIVKALRSLMIIFKTYLVLFNPVFPELISMETFPYNQLPVLHNTF